MDLTGKQCVACEGGVKPLDSDAAKALLAEVPGWELSADAKLLHREYTCSNFKKALQFVNKVGDIAEAERHHPDIAFGWGYVRINLQTHSINGLHMNDFILAAKLNTIGI